MGDVFLEAFIDSLKVLAVLLVCNFLIALIEPKLSGKVKMKGALAPLIGTTAGLLPQCGFSVVATDLYQKRHITVGTLLGVYLATSDEALPIFLSSPESALHILPILGLKFLIGVTVGYTADLLLSKNRKKVREHLDECGNEYEIRLSERISDSKIKPAACGECNQKSSCKEFAENGGSGKCADGCFKSGAVSDSAASISARSNGKKEKLEQYLWHPLVHSLKIFIYIFVVNIAFGLIIYFVGEDKLIAFLTANKYVAPLFAVLVGAVPNCVSSVIISELYIMGGLGFGATLAGLCMNAGLGFVVLLKNTKNWRENLAIIGAMFLISLAVGYIFSAIFNFDVLYLL